MVEVFLPGFEGLETVHHRSIITIRGLFRFRYEHDFRHKASDEPGEHTAVRTTIPRQRYVFLIPGFFHQVTLGNCRPASSKVSEPIVNSIKGVSRMANASLRPS